ncbi:hypothetical protein BLNAU_9475 [Blattamonas nauphoetae]|uniref:Uncharacterized protein n=1 Tax=Blattamonas nauphoetae TaxID=2049346 RepID=A0ABQ9XVV9_9EUKA|nr:hypothetical protein BLNAU_9475 [Blattamonas nauphoetae]
MIIRLKAEQDQQPSLHSVSLPSLPVLPPSQPQHRPQSEQSQQSQFDIAIFAQSLISNDFSNHPSALNYHFEDYIIRYPDVYDISSILSEMNLSINPTLDEHVEINPPPELSSSSEPSPQSEMQKDDVCAESEVQIDNPASDEASLDSISFITQFCERPQPTQHSIVRYDSQLHDSRRSTTGFADDDEMGGFLPQHDNPLSHRLLCIPSTADNQLLLTLSSTAILASLIHVDLVQAYLKISGLIVESAPISESHPSTPIPSIFSERYPHYPSSLTMISQQISPTVLTHSPLSLPSFTSRTTPFILSSPSSYFFSLPQPCHIADCSSEMLKILTTVVPCLSIPPLEQLHSHLNNTFSLVVPRISENHSSDACLSPTGLRTLVHDLTPLSWEAYVLKCIGWNILPSDFASFYLSDINSSFLEANLRKIPKPNPEWVGSQQFIVLNEPSEPSSIPFSDWANLSKRQKQEFVKARRLVSLLHAAHPKADEGQSDMFNLSTFDKTFIKETSTNVQNKQTPTDFAKTLVEQDRSILDPLETFVALFDFTRDALNSLQELLRFLRDEMDYYAEHNPTDLANPDQVLLSKVDLEEETPPPLPEASLFVGCFSDGFDIPNG